MRQPISVENFQKVQSSRFVAWGPPDQNYSFSWGEEESGEYNGKSYYRPAYIFATIAGKNFLIVNDHGRLRFSYGDKNRYGGGQSLTDATRLDLLAQHFKMLLNFIEESSKAKKITPPSISPELIGAFLKIFTTATGMQVGKHLTGIQTETADAVKNPEQYFSKHRKQFMSRGINEPVANLYQIVLLDALLKTKHLAELDWKSESDEITKAVRALSKIKDAQLKLKPGLNIDQALARLNKQLQLEDEEILEWDTDSDAAVFCVVQKQWVTKLVQAAKGINIILKKPKT